MKQVLSIWRWIRRLGGTAIAVVSPTKKAGSLWRVVVLLVAGLGAVTYVAVKVRTAKTRILEEEKTARVQAEKYAGEMQGYYDAQVKLNKDKDKKLRDLTIRLEHTRETTFTHTLLDPVTGLPKEIFETTSKWVDTEERVDRDEVAVAPTVTLTVPIAPASLLGPKCAALRPLGFAVGLDTDGGLAAGLRWRLLPRVVLPLVPDMSISLQGIGTDVLGHPGGLILADVELWRPASR